MLRAQFKSIAFTRRLIHDNALNSDLDQEEVREKLKIYKAEVESMKGWLVTGYQIAGYTRDDGTDRGE